MGKTDAIKRRRFFGEKHPHGRGENNDISTSLVRILETPPRAWGKLLKYKYIAVIGRNTPTGVGKTIADERGGAFGQKHPHGRGENEFGVNPYYSYIETPPRAWGKRLSRVFFDILFRNTPTGVGKT